jgi:hypothetical protein
MSYVLRVDIETFLDITLSANGQALVDSLIPAIEKYAEDYCGRVWNKGASDDITEVFDGGTDLFFPANPPIASIQSITIQGSVYDLTRAYNYGSHIKLSSKAVDIPRAVVIVYRTSATAIPADLKHALIRWISEVFKSSDDAGKVTGRVSSGPVSVDYLTQDGIPKFVEMVLNKYRLEPK